MNSLVLLWCLFSSSILIKLYTFLVCHHLKYCSSIWDPTSTSTLSQSLEFVQLFALKLASRFRPHMIPATQFYFHIPSLSSCCSCAKLTLLFKLCYGLLHSPSFPPQPCLPSPYHMRSFIQTIFSIFSQEPSISNPPFLLLFLCGTLSHMPVKKLILFLNLNIKFILSSALNPYNSILLLITLNPF